MKDDTKQNADVAKVAPTTPGALPAADSRNARPVRGGFGNRPERRGGPRRGGTRPERVKPEFDQKIIDIRRVSRTVAGGRRFAFSVAMVIGNRKGQVGVGLGKGGDTALAIEKANREAKKNLITVPMTKSSSIPFEVAAKYASSRVMIMPARGKGMVAGTSIRNVIELCGLKDVNAKLLSGSKNRLNNARAAMKALSELSRRKMILKKFESAKVSK
ncbi:MAG: 30S ribosomal protein S5 [Candidatus Paceibacterota bacterium]|jgi:small subunit ribosomal protein S5